MTVLVYLVLIITLLRMGETLLAALAATSLIWAIFLKEKP